MEELIPWILWTWTLTAASWWIVAFWLVRRRGTIERARTPQPVATGLPSLSIFKAMPPLLGRPVARPVADAVATFVRQLDHDTEVIVGIEESDRDAWAPVLAGWRISHPEARIIEVCVPRPDRFISPKISWYHALASVASGDLWMWSDADMIAPDGFLAAVRRDYVEDGIALVTAPYVVRRLTTTPTVWEAVFVNVEFYPGALACERFGRITFGFGACLLFSAKTFRKKLDWSMLGARIADDNLVGQTLQPARLSSLTMETLPAEKTWRDAILHYLRWQKTVRWCRPDGFAAQIAIVPMLGWMLAVATNPTSWWCWAGLLATWQIETQVAVALFRLVDCKTGWRHIAALHAWSWVRAVAWAACWFPWPVVFASQGRKWWSLYRCSEVDRTGN
jgi:ceramide glucosyltransferase